MPASIWPGIDVVFLKLDFPVISLSLELELFSKTSAKADGYLCVLCEFFFPNILIEMNKIPHSCCLGHRERVSHQ